MLALAVLTMILVLCLPASMPVLFPEISEDLGLDLVQLGTVWGLFGLSGTFIPLLAGLLSDRFGLKRTLSTICFLIGLTGAMRGISGGFIGLAVTTFIYGLPFAMASIITFKVAKIWFPQRQLGLANTVLTISVAVGNTLGSMITATVMSPLLGGWRNVMFLYGTISFLFGIPWLLSWDKPAQVEPSAGDVITVPMRQAFSRVIRDRNIWLLGFIFMGHVGCSNGVRGYLVLYLKQMGWTTAGASSVLATYVALGVIGVLPIYFIFNRFGSWKAIIFTTVLMTGIGTALLSGVSGPMIWVAIVIGGLAWEAYMVSNFTTIMEGMGAAYTGTAIGLWVSIGRIGTFIAPIIGNRLATINPSLAFIFWAGIAIVPLFCCIYFVKETGRKIRASL